MFNLTAGETQYVIKNVDVRDRIIRDINDDLFDLSVDSLGRNDDPTPLTFFIERIMDKLYPYKNEVWRV